MKTIKKKHHTVGTAPKFNRKIVERSTIDTPNTQILDSSLSWSGIGNLIKRICGIHWFCYVNIAEVNNSFQGMGTRERQLIKVLETKECAALEFRIYLRGNTIYSRLIKPFSGNRFNINCFHNASYIYIYIIY